MNKIAAITIIAIAIVATTAHAQDVVVIKDSRQYAPFNNSGIRVSASFEATTADKDFQAILTRWVKAEGKKLVWEAGGNAGVDAVALNEAASLNKATTFAMAFDQLNQVIGRVHATDHKKPEPLKACQFDDAIVIRTISQPDCGTLH